MELGSASVGNFFGGLGRLGPDEEFQAFFEGSVTIELSMVVDSYRCCRGHLYASDNWGACAAAVR